MMFIDFVQQHIVKKCTGTSATVILAAVILSLLCGAVFIALAGANPLEAYYDMLKSTLGRYYGVGEVISKSIPLVLIAAGVAIGFYGGQTNLGGDGQFYLGAIAAVWTGLLFAELPWPLVFILSWIAACLAGGAWGAIAGVLKAYLNTSEIIVTIMLNYVSVLFVSFLVHGPLKEKGGFIPQTATLPEELHLPIILEATRAHAGILVALIALLTLWFVIHKTVLGYRIRAVGQGLAGARYAGIHCGRYITLSLFLSGALAGLAGAIEVFGIHHRVLEGISSDFGFTAVIVALLGRLKPLGILGSALLLSGLVVGANAMQVSQGVPVSVVLMLESMMVAFVLLGESYRQTAAK
ncbi:ABC transporter permease [Sporomusa malonica]|nr:ABC transporter permease [Sporomusa malonica]